MSIHYRGHQYRLAQEPKAEEPTEQPVGEKAEEPAKDPCGAADPSDPFVKAAKAAMSAANVDGKAVRVCREADGVDVKVSVGERWSGIEAVLTFDFNQKGKLQELILQMCGTSFVAHSGRFGGGKSLNMLLASINVLQQAEFYPRQAAETVQEKNQAKYIEFVRHYVAEMLAAAVELPAPAGVDPYADRTAFGNAIQQMLDAAEKGEADLKMPKDRAETLLEGSRKWMDNQDWKNHIHPLIESQGRQYAVMQEMVDRAVADIIPKHEAYTGDAHVTEYRDDGSIVVDIEVPKPADLFKFAFEHMAGQKKLRLKDAGLGLCGATFASKGDVNLSGLLVSAMVNLAILAGRTAQPELSQPPEAIERAWKSKDLMRAFAKGLVIWHGINDNVRMTYEGKTIGYCRTKAEWQENEAEQKDSTLQIHIEKAQRDEREILRVDDDGQVDRLNHELKVIQKNIGKVNASTGACEIQERR